MDGWLRKNEFEVLLSALFLSKIGSEPLTIYIKSVDFQNQWGNFWVQMYYGVEDTGWNFYCKDAANFW